MIVRKLAAAAMIAALFVAACGPPGPTARPSTAPADAAPQPTSSSAGVPFAPATVPPRLEAPRAVGSPVSRSPSPLASAPTPGNSTGPAAPPTPSAERAADRASGLTPTPTPDLARRQAGGATCHAADLTGSVGFQGATQALAGALRLTNHGATPCTLEGSAEVQLVDANGQVLAVKDVTPPDAGSAQPVTVGSGQPANVMLFWRDWCGPRPALPLRVRASWSGSGGSVTTPLLSGMPSDQRPLDLTPVCNAPSAGSTLSVYPFRLAP